MQGTWTLTKPAHTWCRPKTKETGASLGASHRLLNNTSLIAFSNNAIFNHVHWTL